MKAKTHKSTAKRVKITRNGKGKVTRMKRRARNSRTSRAIGKDTNTDAKNMILSKVESKKVKKLLNI